MAANAGVVVKTLMIVLIFVMVAAYAYVFAIDSYPSCFNLLSRWAIGLLADFFMYIVVFGAWFFYKESSWIMTTIYIVLMLTTGSIANCGYILIQFYKLSPEESSRDPLYFVLAKRKKPDVIGQYTRGPSVTTVKIIFYVLACLMLGGFIYTIIFDLTSNAEAFPPCLWTYLSDIYVLAVILSVWIIYKESSWISAFLWILPLVCLGNITTCVYILRQLSYLSPEQPVSLVIYNRNNRDTQSCDPLLTDHNV